MAEPNLCEHCGSAASPADLIDGHCPLCMVELGFATSATSDPISVRTSERANGHPLIGGYTILRLIGEGGMGAVYEAEQHHPHRTVAIKIVKSGRTSPDALRRFEHEAQALGRLQHPHIARIYEAGTADSGAGPQPYFAMELVRGRSPLDYASGLQLKTRDRLELVAKIADGVHHAHQQGLIHRDLKPANILVDADGQPRILDFGVSRISDAAEPGQTDAGQLVGTLAYMSPEQVSGDPLEIDIRTDVYALGMILYELLAGRRPYDVGHSLPEALQVVRETEPETLGGIERAFRGDVETIAAKALEKDKSRRYGSAAELAADIRRHLRHEPIIARPASTTYQLQKFARRHRAIVIGVAATILALLGGVIVSSLQTARAQRAEQNAVVERDRARDAERTATLERNRAATAEASARTQRDAAQRAEELAKADRNLAVDAEDRARRDRDTLLWQTLARESVRFSDNRLDDDRAALLASQALLVHNRTPGLPLTMVEDALQRAARPGPWSHTLFRGTSAVLSVAISRDDYLACACGDPIVRVWDLRDPGAAPLQLAGHRTGVEAVAFTNNGRYLASGDRNGSVHVWDLQNLKAKPLWLSHANRPIHSVAFSPDGSLVAVSDGDTVVHLWKVHDRQSEPTIITHSDTVQSLAFSRDGRQLAVGGAGLYLWNVSSLSAPPMRVRDVKEQAWAVAISPDGARVASAENSGVHLLNTSPNTAPAVTLTDAKTGGISAVAFTEDGSRVAAGGLRNVSLWDPRKPGVASLRLDGIEGQVMALSFSHDGRYLATGSDRTLRVWDLKSDDSSTLLSPGPLNTMARHPVRQSGASYLGLAFSRDGARLASASDDPNVRVWNLGQIDAAPLVLRGHEDAVLTVAFSPDGSHVASGGGTTSPDALLGLYSSEGRRLVAGGDGIVRVWSLNSPASAPLKFVGHRDAILALLFSRGGSNVSSASADGTVRSWDVTDSRRSAVVLDERSKQLAFALEPYKRWLLDRYPSSTDDLRNQLGKALEDVAKGQSSFFMVALSPDLRQLATVGVDRHTIRVWDLTNRSAPPRLLETRAGTISTIAFSPDGKHLASGGTRPNIQIWDLTDPGKPPVQQGQENVGTSAIAFSPDSARVAYVAGAVNQRAVDIWDRRDPTKQPRRLNAGSLTSIDSLAFSPDGRQLAGLHRTSGRIMLWRLEAGISDYLCSRVWRNLTTEEWTTYVGTTVPYESTCASLVGSRSVSQINVGRRPARTESQPDLPSSSVAAPASSPGSGCAVTATRMEGTRLTITAPLSALVSLAYGDRAFECRVPGVLVGGADWVRSERHDVNITVPDAQLQNAASLLTSRSSPELQGLLRTALENRFSLRVRSENQGVAGYALTLHGQLAIRQSTPEDAFTAPTPLTRRLDGENRPYGDFSLSHMTMADFCSRTLKGILGAPVEDQTGVPGRFQIALEFDQTGVAKPTLAAALQRIGLDLKPAKLSMQVLTIDRAERPPDR